MTNVNSKTYFGPDFDKAVDKSKTTYGFRLTKEMDVVKFFSAASETFSVKENNELTFLYARLATSGKPESIELGDIKCIFESISKNSIEILFQVKTGKETENFKAFLKKLGGIPGLTKTIS